MSVSSSRKIPGEDATGKFATRERTYNYLYDPVYTVSSEVDHMKSRFKAYASNDRVLKIPEYDNMFSCLPRYPRFRLQLDTNDPVPISIDQRWRGHTEQCKEALHQLAGSSQRAPLYLQREGALVSGLNRWKYFPRPLIPFAHQLPPNVILDLPKEEFVPNLENETGQHPKYATVGVQTDYRESETQTDPYSPEYVVRPGTTPSELLTLATLSWGHGLPAGLAEVEMIERTRAKRAWEATLPPLEDVSKLVQRRRMMREMEAEEWAFRESEIQKIADAHKALLTDLLRKRHKDQQEQRSDRLKQLHYKLQKDKEAKLTKINNDYLRAMRKLDSKYEVSKEKLTHSYHFKDYSDLSAHVSPTVRTKDTVLSNNYYLDTFEGLTEIETRFSAFSINTPIKKAQQQFIQKKKNSSQRELQLYEQYKALKKVDELKDLADCVVKIEKPPTPPVTPEVDKPQEGKEEREIAVINLQKLLRGRVIQSELMKDKENHLDLIKEVRTAHALQSEERALQKAEKDRITKLKQERDQQSRKTEAAEATQTKAVDEYVFDILSRELIRLKEERRIHAFTILAERARRLREAEESGRRQMEERLRKEEDEIFKQVVQVNQESVDLYLERIILSASEREVDEQARHEIHQFAKKVNDVACAMEESLESETIVHELMYSFLIPDVRRTSVRRKVQQKQDKHLQAARSIIQGLSVGVVPPPGSRESPSFQVSQDTTEESQEGQRPADRDH